MKPFDPRLTLAEADVAAASLEGEVRAARFAEPTRMQVVVPSVGLSKAPRTDAEWGDQLLFGDLFEVLRTEAGWAWGQAARDGYVGWVPPEALSAELSAPTHWVRAFRTTAFAEPRLRAPARAHLSMNTLVRAGEIRDGFVEVAGMGWAPEMHLAPLGDWETDPAAVAERWLGAPYVWGGRDSLGIDCSGLVQQALYACGLACSRDSDMQAEAVGEEITAGRPALQRNDLVFWRGHVGIMLDSERLLHATAHSMSVVIESLDTVIARTAARAPSETATWGPPIAFRRLNRPLY